MITTFSNGSMSLLRAMLRGSARRMSSRSRHAIRAARLTTASGYSADQLETRVLLSGTAPDDAVQPLDDTYIVRFSDDLADSEVDAWIEATNVDLVHRLRHVFNGAVVRPTEIAIGDGNFAGWQTSPEVVYAEPNVLGEYSLVPNDPLFADQYGLNNTGQTDGTSDADIDATEAWDLFVDSSDVVIAIVDSGTDYLHEDLAPVMWTNPGEIAGNGIDDDNNGFVDDIHGIDPGAGDADPMDDAVGHGTHVAGIAAAAGNNGVGVSGVNQNAQIMSLAIGHSVPSGAAATIALDYMVDMKVNRGVNIVSSNHSYSVGNSQAFEDAVAASIDAGVLFVAAAGNSSRNIDTSPTFPGSYDYPGLVTVAASDHNDDPASFTNFGVNTVDLAAPGVNIMSTMLTSGLISSATGYGAISGTSMASPMVAGAAALLAAASPGITPAALESVLKNTVDPLAAWNGLVNSGGRLNLQTALNNVLNASGGTISGSLWNDLNGDGVRDANEAALGGWTVYLDANGNAQLDAGELSTVSDATTGSYSFTEVAPGSYQVRQVLQPGWENTFPIAGGAAFASADIEITTTGSEELFYAAGVRVDVDDNYSTAQSSTFINLDDFRADPRFVGIDGAGYSVVILDTGIDGDHPFFGPDLDSNGIADRIVASVDFTGGSGPEDVDGHGSNVASIALGSDGTHTGMAPGANIISLKVLGDNGSGNFGWLEQALQWVLANQSTYNIVATNMSLGDSSNRNTPSANFGLGDELAALEAAGVINVSSAGNDYFTFQTEGVGYPAADPSVLGVGAVWDRTGGQVSWSSGAIDFTTAPDRVTSFSQRSETMVDIFAPGAFITGAAPGGGTSNFGGTSQAAPHVAGIAALAQQLAFQSLGRLLTPAEFETLIDLSGTTINDGDDEDDNVTNTGKDFQRIDVLALGEAILALAGSSKTPNDGFWVVNVTDGGFVNGVDFGNRVAENTISGSKWEDIDADGIRDAGEPGLSGWTIFADLNGNGLLDVGGTVEPDDYSDGAVLDTVNPDVTLSEANSSGTPVGSITASSAAVTASTGTRAFNLAGNTSNLIWSDSARLRADFHIPVHSVSIDVISDDPSDAATLQAFDATGNLLDSQTSADLGTGQSETVTVTSATPIAYVMTTGSCCYHLDNLVYGSVAEPSAVTDANGHFALTGVPNGTFNVLEVLQPGWSQTYAGVLTAQNILANGSFESGDFSGWSTTDPVAPFRPWSVTGDGQGGGFGLPSTTLAQDGAFVAWNGFDGGSAPDEYVLTQDVTIPTSSSVTLSWEDRAQWDFTLGNTPVGSREVLVEVVDPATGLALETLSSFGTGTSVGIGDTGWLSHSSDITNYAGQNVRLRFRQVFPDIGTGPGQYELDNVRLDIAVQGPNEPGGVSVTLGGGESIDGILFGNTRSAASDFGDAPNTYGTTIAANGPRHLLADANNPQALDLQLGNSIDAEADGLASPFAQGDDLDGSSDEDGIVFTSQLTAGQTATFDAIVGDSSGNGGVLAWWADFDGSGTFEAGERFEANVTPGINQLSFFIPATAVGAPGLTNPDGTFVRFRLGSPAAAAAGELNDPTGLARDGEVEDYAVQLDPPLLDFGDAPNTYGTTIAANGPRHLLADANNPQALDLQLGNSIDAEADRPRFTVRSGRRSRRKF